MKTRTLTAMAVAAALGFSASAFAGSGYEVMTPSSPNESGSSLAVLHNDSASHSMSSSFNTAQSSPEMVSSNIGGLELSDATDWSASYDQMAEASGPFSPDGYIMSWTPVSIDGLDYYLIDMQPVALIFDDEVALLSEDESLGLTTSDEVALTQEDAVATVLAESPVEDSAEVG